MEKKIQKKQKEINDAQEDRARKKVTYDAQVIILEGQRDTVRELEKRAEDMLKNYVESDNVVKYLINELNLMSNNIEDQEKEGSE